MPDPQQITVRLDAEEIEKLLALRHVKYGFDFEVIDRKLKRALEGGKETAECRCPENGVAGDCPIHSVQYRDSAFADEQLEGRGGND